MQQIRFSGQVKVTPCNEDNPFASAAELVGNHYQKDPSIKLACNRTPDSVELRIHTKDRNVIAQPVLVTDKPLPSTTLCGKTFISKPDGDTGKWVMTQDGDDKFPKVFLPLVECDWDAEMYVMQKGITLMSEMNLLGGIATENSVEG